MLGGIFKLLNAALLFMLFWSCYNPSSNTTLLTNNRCVHTHAHPHPPTPTHIRTPTHTHTHPHTCFEDGAFMVVCLARNCWVACLNLLNAASLFMCTFCCMARSSCWCRWFMSCISSRACFSSSWYLAIVSSFWAIRACTRTA